MPSKMHWSSSKKVFAVSDPTYETESLEKFAAL